MEIRVLDTVNAVVELLILAPFAWDCYHIVRVKTSVSTDIRSTVVWFSYCVWSAFYFLTLGQHASGAVGVFWCACYLVKVALVWHYRPSNSKCAAGGK